jgi:hypothetical protein
MAYDSIEGNATPEELLEISIGDVNKAHFKSDMSITQVKPRGCKSGK